MMLSTRHQGIGMTSLRTRERLIQRLREEGIENSKLLAAMLNTPRHIFVDEALASRAYEDTALPIGHGQTISQPYIVARMTEALLAAGPLDNVLEIGTGSGYQCAILAQLVRRVYSVERIELLHKQARTRMQELQLRNARLKYSDGGMGLPEYAPFDGIMVTAAAEEIPQPLLEQLAIGGRMILPTGSDRDQELLQIIRTPHGFEQTRLETVIFVPLKKGLN
jgi:protein-L-isoaspartate(D-aspartate) O-methyltransferase